MNDDRDPFLESLVAQAETEIQDDEFTTAVMHKVAGRQRNVLIGRIGIVALIIIVELALSAPFQGVAGTITDVLGANLIDLNGGWVSQMASPLNSLAGVIGVLLVGLQFIYRRAVR